MPVTLNVGYSRKIGEPNYGSRGASVNLEIDRELTLSAAPEDVAAQIEELFALARTAVEAELARSHNRPRDSAPDNGQAETPRITSQQVQAIQSLATRKRIDLASLLKTYGESTSLDQLTRQQAGRLITELNSRNRPSAC